MVRIEEVKAVKFAMARCPRCGLLVTAIEKQGRYSLVAQQNCHAVSAREEGGVVLFRFPQDQAATDDEEPLP